ncbi:flavin reductase (DIM6/NTAB) family NADH-FMN oxidoreductase RutF [Saccharothrix tamanrassetensis]|uniref:Flavin reductase (DIM6/NTAB) family NADH-FMN oxidoreductase RutF n=1 Tax=Saccharothrix tamanrassetensis TaxID=1051531 RepID=A0A841CR89_9PSEU|nr:flavin reductase family protein [Saccharothrix tamanrassetensis]MBB5958557.1 flavin reductase (DIM6/NTAB) family NADH-FMN oxidoreductase RutF [Saccharothrix tamanrassetensis]
MGADFLPQERPGPTAGGSTGNGVTPGAFREFMGAYFTGVTIITSIDDEGRPHGLTCNSLTSVTLSPPTLLVSLDARSGTLDALRSRSGFVVNLLHDGGQGAAELFASPDPDRFELVNWRRSPRLGLPWLVDDAYAEAECEVDRTMVVGDHVLVFGRVVDVEGGSGSPLLYGMRNFARRLTDTSA